MSASPPPPASPELLTSLMHPRSCSQALRPASSVPASSAMSQAMSGVQHIVAAHMSQSLLPVSSATVHEVVEVTSGSADESEVVLESDVLASVAGVPLSAGVPL